MAADISARTRGRALDGSGNRNVRKTRREFLTLAARCSRAVVPERIKIVPLERVAAEDGFEILCELRSAVVEMGIALMMWRAMWL